MSARLGGMVAPSVVPLVSFLFFYFLDQLIIPVGGFCFVQCVVLTFIPYTAMCVSPVSQVFYVKDLATSVLF